MKMYTVFKISFIIIVVSLFFGIVSWEYQVSYDLVRVRIDGETLWMTRPEALELPGVNNIVWYGDVQTTYPLKSYWLTYPALCLGVIAFISTKRIGKIPTPTASSLKSDIKRWLVKYRKMFSSIIGVLVLVPMFTFSVVDHGVNNDQLYLYLFAYIGFLPIPLDFSYLVYPIVFVVFIAGYRISLKVIGGNNGE